MDEIIFDGKRFTRFGKYWRSARKFLHRAVWEAHRGAIPSGWHVHHKDGDRDNNDIANLEAVAGAEHLSAHHKGHTRRPDAALEAVALWRKTEEGKRFAREMGLRNAHFMRAESAFACECCGKQFTAKNTGSNRFCAAACKAKARRDSGADRVAAKCVECGVDFMANKFRPATCCSLGCGRKRWLKTQAGIEHLARLASLARDRRRKE